MTREVVIVEALRTPIGRAGKGSLAGVRPDDLAAHAVAAVVGRAPEVPIDEVIVGCGFPWGEQGMNLGRSVALLAGLPMTTPGHTVSRFCASSLQALRAAHHAVAIGEVDAIVAAGVESVSRVGSDRHLAEPNPRYVGPDAIADLYVTMIQTAQNVAERFGVGREELDRYAQRSQERAVAAQAAGFFAREIVPVPLPGRAPLEHDECPRASSTLEKLAALEPVSGPDGVITAGNACPLNDGAAAVLVMSAEAARRHGLRPRARILASAVTGLDPAIMGVGPIEAVRAVLRRAGVALGDVDVVELNEAFASTGARRGARGVRDRPVRRPLQPARRRDRGRPPLRHERGADHGHAAQRSRRLRRHARARDDVRRRRPGPGHARRAPRLTPFAPPPWAPSS